MKTKYPWLWKLTGTCLLAGLPPGCMLNLDEDADEFRDAIPRAEAVRLAEPEASAGGTASSATRTAGEDAPWAGGPWSEYYGFTRIVRDGVNGVTGVILGGLWLIVHTRPSTLSEDEAVWGPHSDALEPAEWQLRVTEVRQHEYDYVLEGRPKGTAEPFRAVLTGKGWGRKHDRHGDGHFEIDLDTARELDPLKHQDDSGTVRITHDLPPTITQDLWLGDRFISAEVRPTDESVWWTVDSSQYEDGSGTLVVNAEDDIDETRTTAAEAVQISSQWRPDGAGRADITISGGDLPTEVLSVSAVECWGSDFYRSYYTDSIDHQPTEGEASACAFAGPPQT